MSSQCFNRPTYLAAIPAHEFSHQKWSCPHRKKPCISSGFPNWCIIKWGYTPPPIQKLSHGDIYIYIWWSIGKHQWSWSHIWYPNVYIWRFPQIGLPCTTQHPRHGWSEGPGHLTTRTESPAPAARSPRSQPLGPCWLFCFCHFLNQQPWLMVDDECSTMAVDDI